MHWQQMGTQQLDCSQPQEPQEPPPLEPPQEPQPPLEPPHEPPLEQAQAGTQQHTGLQQHTGTQQLEPQPPQPEPQPPQPEPQPPEQPQQPMFLVGFGRSRSEMQVQRGGVQVWSLLGQGPCI